MSIKASSVIGMLCICLTGCTAIPVEQLQKAAQSAAGGPATCGALQNLVDLDPNITHAAPGALATAPASVGAGRPFAFLMPAGQQIGLVKGLPGAAPAATTNVTSFSEFQRQLQARYDNSDLPKDVKESNVTKIIFNSLVKTFAQAQIGAAEAHGYAVDQATKDLVNSVPDSDIHMYEFNDFTTKVKNTMYFPQIGGPPKPGTATAATGPTANTFVLYFSDYYEGNFYDRFGNNITKPNITSTSGSGVTYSIDIPDSVIASALTVTIEYLGDLIDPTPVLGDKDLVGGKPPVGTNFYPGKAPFTNVPEALKSGLANYKNISNNSCGVRTDNAVVLYDAANAAGDATSTVSGLVSQSWGGAGFSFLGFVKFSIGDNDTLGTVVKTAADRVAQRISLAASYWALDRIGQGAPHAAVPGAPPVFAAPPSSAAAPYFRF